jgi:SAM-dependent methyltransferase
MATIDLCILYSRICGKLALSLKSHKFLFSLAKAVQSKKHYVSRIRWWLVGSRATRNYFLTHRTSKLQIGAGTYCLEGWFNTDIHPDCRGCFYMDARRRFPFDDSTFDYVYSEHMIEHLTYNEGRLMLRECFRILKPNGRIRISTPDLEAFINLYTAQKTDLQKRYVKWVIDAFLPKLGGYRESFVINHIFHNWEHRFIYDRTTLRELMESIGFVRVSYHAVGESNDRNLVGLESHGMGGKDQEMVKFETMVVEATRPPSE